MLLRRSGEASEKDYDMAGMLTGSQVGVEGEAVFDRLVQLTYEESYDALHQFLFESKQTMSPEKLVDAVAIATAFNGITKVANASGLPLDQATEETTRKLRMSSGINEFADDLKSDRYN